jgi:hypothetical protein
VGFIIAVCVAGAGVIARALAQISIALSQVIPYVGIVFLIVAGAWAFERITDCNARKSKADMITRITEYQAITAMMRGEKPEIMKYQEMLIEMQKREDHERLPLPIRLLETNGDEIFNRNKEV